MKVICNINRICEVEDAVVEWIEYKEEDKNISTTPKSQFFYKHREQPIIPIQVKPYMNRFIVNKVEFNELDQHYLKI